MRILSTLSAAVLGLALSSAPGMAAEPGTVTIVGTSGPQTMDGCQVSVSSTGRILKQNVLESLTEIDAIKGGAVPRLATSWEQEEDGSWLFKLRQGVKFHDGSPLTPEAVIYSFDRMLDPAMGCDALIFVFSGVEVKVEAVDDETVRIVTNPVQPILPLMTESLPIVPLSTPRNEITRTPIGTGPYVFTNWDTQTSVTLERFDGYWGEQPQVEKANFIWRDEASVRGAMVDVGEADLALSIGEQDAKDTDVVFQSAELSRIKINTDQAPFDDVRVRKALNLALDRQALIGTLLNSKLTLANQIVGPSVFGYSPTIGQYEYDPVEAKRLLDEARADGAPLDRPIRMISISGSSTFSNQDEVIEALISMWQQVGLNVRVEALEMGLFRSSIRRDSFEPGRDPTLVFSNHDNTTGDAGMSIFSKYHSGNMTADLPIGEEAIKEMDALIESGMAAVGDERLRIFQEVMRLEHEEVVPEVWLYYMVNIVRMSDRITYEPNARTNAVIELADITLN
ncbi:ABC transporter substrate-binding protein [Devosia sp. A449]